MGQEQLTQKTDIPVCPHCFTKQPEGDVNSWIESKTYECVKCGKGFSVSMAVELFYSTEKRG